IAVRRGLVDDLASGVAVGPGAGGGDIHRRPVWRIGHRASQGGYRLDPARDHVALDLIGPTATTEADSGQADPPVRVAPPGRIELAALRMPLGLGIVPRLPAYQQVHRVAVGFQPTPQGLTKQAGRSGE